MSSNFFTEYFFHQNSSVCDKEMNNTQKAHTFNTEVLNVPMTEKYTDNSDVSNDCFDKTKMKELFDNRKISDVSDVSDNLKEMQWKMVDDDDGLNSNYENKIQLETIEKELERLKKQNELIMDKVYLITNKYKFRNDQITTIKVEMNNVQNEMKKIHDRKIKKELENVICFKTIIDKMVRIHNHIDKFKVIVNSLETAVEETSENKKIMTEIMELSKYMKNQYCSEVTENQRQFTEQISKHVSEIDQLNAYMNIKSKEVDEWEKRITGQQLCNTMHQKLLIRVEKYITDMLSIIVLHIKQSENENNQLTVPNENNKETVLKLAKQLEEIHTESLKMQWEVQDMTIDDD